MKRFWCGLSLCSALALVPLAAHAQEPELAGESGDPDDDSAAEPDEPEPSTTEAAAEPSAPPASPPPAEPATPPPPVAPVAAAPAAATTSMDDGSDDFSDVDDGGDEEEVAYGEDRWGQRNFGLSAMVLQYNGFGAGVRGGWHRAGVSASVAYNPIFVFFAQDIELINSVQVNADVYVMFNRQQARFHAGIAPGYKFNHVMGHAGGLSFYGLLNFSKMLALQIQAGFAYFPDGDQNVRSQLSQCGASGQLCSFSLDPGLLIGASIGIAIFP